MPDVQRTPIDIRRSGTVVAARPRPAWASCFEELIETLPRERETGVSRASTAPEIRIQLTYRLAATTA